MLECKLHKRRKKLQVDVCLTPTTVHLTRVKPWVSPYSICVYRESCNVADLCCTVSIVVVIAIFQELLHDHCMDRIVHCCSSAQDSRALFLFVSMPSEDKIVCFHLRSSKKSKAVTVSLRRISIYAIKHALQYVI